MRFVHGKWETPEYEAYHGMIRRCYNSNHATYSDYGGRGITVCHRWRESFLSFYEDMGERPSKNHSIDRIDNDGNYEPSNCRWATPKEQQYNTRRNLLLEFNNKKQCLAAWAEEIGIKYPTLYSRLRSGWTNERMLTEKCNAKRRKQLRPG